MSIFIALLASIFSVVNPFGALPLYLAMTSDYTRPERQRLCMMTSFYFVLILLAFFFAGSYILSFFGLSVNALRIAGGVVIFNSGMALLNDKYAKSRAINKEVKDEARIKEDISFSPLAMPMLSGPGSISLLIGMAADYTSWEEKGIVAAVILINGLIVYLVLGSAPYLYRVLGVSGLKAGSRIMGFIVMSIGVQYIIAGIVALVKTFLHQ